MDLIGIFRTFHPNAEEYTFFSSAHEHSPEWTTSWVTNQTSVNLRKLKSYQAYLTTRLDINYKKKKKNCKKHKHMKIKQYVSKQPTGY